ncbi:hypothetical protein M5K25_003277 [Dendrobium thyrsiflorum]|uniref:Uncharacterized protein n=1 Tax=Dendrobium thyrsiflorum TaxID=117978 RepID=A0ABD0VJJ8_DENTH
MHTDLTGPTMHLRKGIRRPGTKCKGYDHTITGDKMVADLCTLHRQKNQLEDRKNLSHPYEPTIAFQAKTKAACRTPRKLIKVFYGTSFSILLVVRLKGSPSFGITNLYVLFYDNYRTTLPPVENHSSYGRETNHSSSGREPLTLPPAENRSSSGREPLLLFHHSPVLSLLFISLWPRSTPSMPFFTVLSFSDAERIGLDPVDKCRLRNGLLKELFILELVPIKAPFPLNCLLKELFMLELAPINGTFPTLNLRSEFESRSTSASKTAIRDTLFLPFSSYAPGALSDPPLRKDFLPWNVWIALHGISLSERPSVSASATLLTSEPPHPSPNLPFPSHTPPVSPLKPIVPSLLPASPLASTYSLRRPCMADPEVDHGFIFDDQGRTDILCSPFFDVYFSYDETANDYIDRILYQLTLSIEKHIRPGHWVIIGRRPSPPTPATSPPTKVLGFLFLVDLVNAGFTAEWGEMQPPNRWLLIRQQTKSLHLGFRINLPDPYRSVTHVTPDKSPREIPGTRCSFSLPRDL